MAYGQNAPSCDPFINFYAVLMNTQKEFMQKISSWLNLILHFIKVL